MRPVQLPLLLCLLGSPALARAEGTGNDACLECHADSDDEASFADGSKLSLKVDPAVLARSQHARSACADCHRDVGGFPHPDLKVKSAREYRIEQAGNCKRCHYAYYTRVADSIHYAQLEKGDRGAPTCVDCHGGHDVGHAATPRVKIDQRCGTCHAKISAAYQKSVHGKALLASGNADVPVCTDCHGAHDIRDPRKAEWRAASHEVCARCHADEPRMKRYGLSSGVLVNYLDDFHGQSNRLYAMGAGKNGRAMATCTDCHGVHDIASVKSTADRAAIRGRLAGVCQGCHKGATPAFADAWLPHYTPTLTSAPLVWGIRWAYRILIPFIVLGLVLHILLHLYRVRAHR